jgi:hypothetical protein
MASENTQGGRPSNEEIEIRRGRIKEMLLQGATYREMEQALGVSSATIYADVSYWQEYFKKLAQDNPEMAKMTFSKVQQTLGEIDIVKRQYWSAYNQLLEEQKEQVEFKRKWREELEKMKLDYQTAVENKNREEMRRLTKLLKEQSRIPRLPSLHKAQLENLKLIMDRIDKEAKLLNLFNPGIGQPSGRNAITWDNFKNVMLIVKQLILDLVPEDQRTYAFQRLRRVKIDEVRPEDVIDAQVVEQAPKVGLTRIQAPEVAPEPEKEAPTEAPVEKVEPKKAELDNQGLEDLDI